ncbi:hypothetical protein Cgig2_008279 [Carnegiea gigantea]|uniref:Glycosyltransferases n=1 Tax=Carnegiea gigantea TaxID=171969 RepID=A0A9Q1L0I3_9CARY|nr:hypothetical protein Cgig2_008279 [Carnegiea gigantea]
MASIRRTLSPANHDRASSFQNGSTPSPLSLNSPSQKPSSSRLFVGLRRFFAGALPERPSRRKSWRKSFYRCLLCFFIGLLLGVLPFGHIDDVRTQDFSFEIKPEAVRVQEDEIKVTNAVSKPDDVEVKFDVMLKEKFDYQPRKLLIVVTPTYNRSLQAYYLNRLAQVLKLVNPPVLWIVVEMNAQSPETAAILRNTGVMYRHLVCKKNSTDIKDRGVQQRNTALEHIELHKLDGIVYFADDDNIYALELFERIREIRITDSMCFGCFLVMGRMDLVIARNIRDIAAKSSVEVLFWGSTFMLRFGTWPVAMLAQSKNKAILEGPVCNGSQVIGWHTNEKSKRLRRFHVDMSGFAFNSTILWDSKRWKRPFVNPIRQLDTIKEGFQETTFIEQLVAEESQMEGIPAGCSKIMNWHLHLDARGVLYPRGWILQRNLDAALSID